MPRYEAPTQRRKPVPDLHPSHRSPRHRLVLFVVRRMAVGGTNDAMAANALLGTFGGNYRRPLILMRAMMLELARASMRTIALAPICCSRMTGDEARLLAALGQGTAAPRDTLAILKSLLDTENALGAFASVQAVAEAFADLGQPLGLYGR